jgi:hypothetical protein
MNTWKQIRSVAWAASIVVWGGAGISDASGQADAWILANTAGTAGTWVNLAPGAPAIGAAVVLPTPGGPEGYTGQVPTRSHHIRTNGEGALIFFAVDGNLYDGDGYLIADARSPGCSECLAPGIMEFLSVPVPGQCGVYYLLSAVPFSPPVVNSTYVQVAVLDMNLPRDPNAPAQDCSNRMGRLLVLGEELAYYHPSMDNWFASLYPLQEEGLDSPPSGKVQKMFIWSEGKARDPQMRVVSGVGPDDPSFLFLKLASTVHVYRITDEGINPVQVLPWGSVFQEPFYVPLDGNYTSPVTQTALFRDCDVRRTPNGQIRFAATSFGRFSQWPADENENFITMLFDGNTGEFISGSNITYNLEVDENLPVCNAPGNVPGGIRGCAIAEDGQRVYLSLESTTDCITWANKFGYVDVTTGQFTDLNPTLGISASYLRSRIYRNRDIATGQEAIYLPSPAGIGVVSNINSGTPGFTGSAAWAANAPAFDEEVSISTGYFQGFLNISVSGDQHLSAASKEQCCGYFETVPGAVVEGYTQATGTTSTWNGGTNTVQAGSADVGFTCDVVVRSGATLIVSNMNWKFDKAARLIVEQGGFLRMTNCTLTGMTCEQTRWPGIQVHGLPTSTQQGFGQYIVPIDQGMVELTNCNVSEATIGILTGSADVTSLGILYNIASDQGGAVVIANGCTFRNCVTSVDMRKYPDFVPNNGQPLPLNRSRFNGTTFVVDEPSFYAPFEFKRLVRLDRVSGILFRKCHFQNLVNDAEYATLGSAALGYGIESYESQFQVLPSCSILLNVGEECPVGNIVPSTFTGLDHGIHAIGGPNALRNFTVDGARFTDNICGVYVKGVIGFVAKRNTFQLGNRNVSLTNAFEEFWDQHHRGLYSFIGSRFTVMDNTLFQSGTNRTEGIVIGFSGEEDEIVFRNNASNLVQAYIGEGQCADEDETASKGLWFKCNDNSNNTTNFRSRIVPGGGEFADQTIRTNQGSIFPVVVPADNEFDRTAGLMDFVNDGCDYNAISYWWADPVSPFKPEYTVCVSEDNDVNGVPIVRNPGNCLTRTRQREFMPTTTEGLLQQAEEEKLEYGDQRYLYEQLIDGGNTDEVLLEISSAWPQEAWALRSYLLDLSPFLTVEVLKQAVDKPYFPMAMKAEVCIANPDATKKDGFLKWLQYDALFPMPEHLIASIEASWDQKTYRTSLENALAMHRSELVQSLNQVTEILTGDTVYDPTDSLQAVWQVLRSPGARYAEALLLMQQGQMNQAHAVVSAIPSEHELRPKEMDERGRMLQVIDLMQAVKADDRDESHLTVAEQNNLAALVEGQLDRPSVWAQNLLCWFYERCTAPPSGGDETPKSAKPQRRPLADESTPMLAVQPNPATTWATFTITLDHEPKNAMVVVRDAQGRIMQQEVVQSAEVQLVWDTRQLAQGLYSVELLEDGKRLETERLIVQH